MTAESTLTGLDSSSYDGVWRLTAFALRLLLLIALLPSRTAYAQAKPDTLPERVIEQVYDAINRCDRAAWREPDGLVKVTRRIVLGPTS